MKKVLFVGLILALSGCASLRVEVSILERSIVDDLYEDEQIAEILPTIRVETADDINRQVNEIQNAHFAVYAGAAEDIEQEAETLASTAAGDAAAIQSVSILNDIASGLVDGYSDVWSGRFVQFSENWIAQNVEIQRLDRQLESDAENSNALRGQLLRALTTRDELISNFFLIIREDLDLTVDDAGRQVSEPIQRVAEILNSNSIVIAFDRRVSELFEKQALVELFASGGLEHSRYASVVVGAPEAAWKEEFDFAEGGGVFGNLDVAIKALGPTNFTVKGLTFNPADVALAASKVTTQSLLLAAQISGVPVNIKGTPTGTGANLASSSAGLQTVRTEILETQRNIQSFNGALESIAQAILDEATEIESGDTDRMAEALRAIQAVYTSQQTRLGGLQSRTGATE